MFTSGHFLLPNGICFEDGSEINSTINLQKLAGNQSGPLPQLLLHCVLVEATFLILEKIDQKSKFCLIHSLRSLVHSKSQKVFYKRCSLPDVPQFWNLCQNLCKFLNF